MTTLLKLMPKCKLCGGPVGDNYARVVAQRDRLAAACKAIVREANGRNHSFHCSGKSGGECDCAVGLARAALAELEN